MLFNKNSITTLFVTVLLSSSLNSIAMEHNPRVSQTIKKLHEQTAQAKLRNQAKLLDQRNRTALHWIIATSPCMLSIFRKCAKKMVQKQFKETLTEAPIPTQELYCGIFKQHNAYDPNNPLCIKIAPKDEGTAMLGPGLVRVSEKESQEISSMYEKLQCPHKATLHQDCSCPDSKATQKILNKHRFIAYHEATHEKENHTTHMINLDFCFPFITHLTFTLLKITKGAPTIKGGIAKLCVSLFLSHLTAIYMERRADNGVPNQKALLKGGADYFMQHHNEHEEQFISVLSKEYPHCSKEEIEKKTTEKIYSFIDILFGLFDEHQNSLVRSQMLQKRADQAEK